MNNQRCSNQDAGARQVSSLHEDLPISTIQQYSLIKVHRHEFNPCYSESLPKERGKRLKNSTSYKTLNPIIDQMWTPLCECLNGKYKFGLSLMLTAWHYRSSTSFQDKHERLLRDTLIPAFHSHPPCDCLVRHFDNMAIFLPFLIYFTLTCKETNNLTTKQLIMEMLGKRTPKN